MKNTLLSFLKFAIFLGAGLLLIWLAVKDLSSEDREQIWTTLKNADYSWVVLSMLAGILSHISRSVRWKMLLQPVGFNPGLDNTFYAVMIGYLGNLALPRLGEILRCGILKRYEKVPITPAFGTVITERAIDMLTLILLFIVSVWLEYAKLAEFLDAFILTPLSLKFSSLFENSFLLIMMALIFMVGLGIVYLLRHRLINNPALKKVIDLIKGFYEGLRSVTKVKQVYWFIFHSLFIWSMYLTSVYVCVFAFQESKALSLSECLVIMCFGSLGVIATPGGIGAYQWIVLQLMLLLGYSTVIGVAFGWVVWLAQFVVVLLGGLSSFGMLALKKEQA